MACRARWCSTCRTAWSGRLASSVLAKATTTADPLDAGQPDRPAILPPMSERRGHAAHPRVGTRRPTWMSLAIALMLVLGIRLAYVSIATPLPVDSDASGYDAAASRLLATGTYAYPVGEDLWADNVFREDAAAAYLALPSNAFAMPGYTWFVAGAYAVSRNIASPPGRIQSVRVAQAILGVLTIALLFVIADTLLGRRAAWWTLGLNAVYPPSLWAAGFLLTETVFTLLLVGQAALILWASRSRRMLAYGLLGVLTGLAIYVRPVAAFVPLLLIPLEMSRRPRHLGRLAAGLGVLVVTVVLVMAPWVIRNARLYGTFMPTTSAAALPMVQGEMMARDIQLPIDTIAQFAPLGLYGNDDHRYAVTVAARAAAAMPPLTRSDAVPAQLRRGRMLFIALTSPFGVPDAHVPFLGRLMQIALLVLAGVGLWRRRGDIE